MKKDNNYWEIFTFWLLISTLIWIVLSIISGFARSQSAGGKGFLFSLIVAGIYVLFNLKKFKD